MQPFHGEMLALVTHWMGVIFNTVRVQALEKYHENLKVILQIIFKFWRHLERGTKGLSKTSRCQNQNIN